jgi:hypothetical protein
MERLNIPLRRTRKTTRHTRRVVWILAGVLGLLTLLGVYLLSTVWFTRDTLSHVRPVDTVATIRLLPTEDNAPIIKKHLNSSPIIANRGITVGDILPAVHGEFALYLQNNGSLIVGLRSEREDLPSDLLDANEIVIQNPKPGVFLLSDTLVATKKPNTPHTYHLPIHWIGENHLGSMTLHNNDTRTTGHIGASLEHLTIRFPKQTMPVLTNNALSDTEYAGLSTPLWTNKLNSIPIQDSIAQLTDPLGGIAPIKIVSAMQERGELYLGQTNGEDTFLLTMQRNGIKAAEIKDTLKTIAALRKPETRKVTLPDNSIIEEIIADPDQSELETDTISGVRFLKTPTGSQSPVLGGEIEDSVIFANDANLVQRWIDAKEKKDKSTTHAAIRPGKLLEVLYQYSGAYETFPFFQALNTNSKIIIEKGLFFTNIRKE